MSLTSYRAAPPRAEIPSSYAVMGPECPRCAELSVEEIVNGFLIWCVLACCTGFNAWRRPTLPSLER